MIDVRTSWLPALGRIVRFEALLAWRAARGAVRSPSDVIAIGVAGFVGVLLIAAALQKMLALEHSRYFLLITLIPGFVTYRAAWTASEKMRRSREFGILSPDAAEQNVATGYAVGVAAVASLLSVPLAAILASSLSETAALSWVLGIGSAGAGMAAGLSSRRRGRSVLSTLVGASSAPRRLTIVAGAPVASIITTIGISDRRRLHPIPARSHRSLTIVAAGLVLGIAASILPLARESALPGILIAVAALVILLWLTRLDTDLSRALTLAGVSPLAAGWVMLRSAWLFCAGLSLPALVAGVLSPAFLAPAAAAILAALLLSILLLLRAWRIGRMSRRTADLMASADIAIIALSTVLAAWLAPFVVAILLWRLHRQASTRLFAL